MIKRPALCACWVLCAVTGLVLFQATTMLAEEGDDNTQSTLKSAVQRELDALYERDGRTAPNMSPSSRSASSRSASGSSSASSQGVQSRGPSTDSQAIQRTASRTAPSSSQGKSEIQKQLEAMYARDGRDMPEMNFPAYRQDEEDLDRDEYQADEELRRFEDQRVAERDARRDFADEQEEEAGKPSLLRRLNPFRNRSRERAEAASRQHGSQSRTAQSASRENSRRRASEPQELNPESADPRMTESKSRFRFLPSFLRRDKSELPEEEPISRPSEESLANRSRRSMHQAAPEERDERPSSRLERRALPREDRPESIVREAAPPRRRPSAPPAKVVEKAPKQDAEEWLAPWEEKSERVADKPVREERSKSASRDADMLDWPFDKEFGVAETETQPEKRTAENEPSSPKIEADAPQEKVASSSSNVRSAPHKVDADSKGVLPYQDDFPNPFTEMTENEADGGGSKEEKVELADTPAVEAKPTVEPEKPTAPQDDNPFTGLKLEQQKLAAAPKFRKSPVAEKVASAKKEDAPQIRARKTLQKPAAESPKETLKVADAGAPNPFEPEIASELENEADPLLRAKMRRLGTRRGLAGLKGFCPVALRDRRDLVDTAEEFTSTYEGRLYHFSSNEAKTAFEAEPEKYAPAMGGIDVIVQTNSHQTVDGTLDHAVWFHDKLYLFSTAETLEAFVLNPSEYTSEE